MSIRDEARQEAERRWPGYPTVGFSGANDRQQAFIDGAVWATEQADHVERIARNLAQTSTLTEQDALVLVKTAQKIAEVEQPDREPRADTGCPHEACEIDTAGNPTRCADCGDYLDSVPDREPSDAEAEAAADAIIEASFGQELPEAPVDLARAALLASQEVRNRG